MSAELTTADVQAYLLADVDAVLPLIRDHDVSEDDARDLLLNCLSAKYVEGMSRGFGDASAMVKAATS